MKEEVDEAAVFAAAATLGRSLVRRGWKVVTAESCTGGLIARALTETSGSSAWFERGFVTYGDVAKRELLGVDPELLVAHGAVSEAVALAMARGALGHSHSERALAVTGIAGPDGGTPAKPVGTVCFGWASVDGTWRTGTECFTGDRAQVRLQAAHHALGVALEQLRDAGPPGEAVDGLKAQD